MSSFLQAPPRITVDVVSESVGHFSHPDGWGNAKSRLWIFNDKTGAVYMPGPSGSVVRQEFEISHVTNRGTGMTIILPDNRVATMTKKGCACGFGAVAYAGPIEERYAINWIRPAPPWFAQQ